MAAWVVPFKDTLPVSNQAAAQKVLDSDSIMSPELSPFGLPLDNMAERRRSQALIGVADVEANLSEEKLLQVDMTDGGKVGAEESLYNMMLETVSRLRPTFSIFPSAPPPAPCSFLLHEDSAKQSGLLHLQLPPEEPGVRGRDGR